MAAASAPAPVSALGPGPAPVTLVIGEEEFLVDRTVRELAARARAALAEAAGLGGGGLGGDTGGPDDLGGGPGGAGSDGGDLHDIEATALGQGELATLTSPSLFGGGSVVIIRAAQNAPKEVAADLAGYAKAPSPDAVVIIAHAGGAKGKALVNDLKKAGARVVERQKITRASDRADFVKGEFKCAGRQADSGAVQALLEAIGGDLRELASAVDQLVSDTGGRITAPVVARYYRGRAEATGFSVADHAVEGRLADALEQLRWALATGTAPVLITSALANGVRLLGRVGGAGNSSAASLAGEIGAPPWKIDQVRRQLRGWHPSGVAAALKAVAEADAQVKGDSVSAGYALERAIRRIVQARSAR